MQIDICCNTEDEVLFRNIEINSRRNLEWVTEVPEHDGHAVIVGGGPSLIDDIEKIRRRQSLGQKVFALNGASRFLLENGISIDFQIVLDARPENAMFVKGITAGEYLISSQCDPSLFSFDVGTAVKVWHPAIECIEQYLPGKKESLTLIGGGTTVGLSAMCLSYTMGYRKLHLFGYDSSHRETSHAYSQPMNDREPICKVTVFGKTFKASLAMAKQAEFFPTVCDKLIDLGCVITVDGDGLLPFITREIAKRSMQISEQEKYTAMWGFQEYRSVAPGELVANAFIDLLEIKSEDIVIDFGCGTGRGAKKIRDLAGCEMILVDFTSNSLDPFMADENFYTFHRHDLTEPLNIKSEKGFCTDVMEHIPPDQVDTVINNIMRASRRVFFQISLIDDNCGSLIGHPLHLSVHPFSWWIEKFTSLGYTVTWSEDQGISALYLVNS